MVLSREQDEEITLLKASRRTLHNENSELRRRLKVSEDDSEDPAPLQLESQYQKTLEKGL